MPGSPSDGKNKTTADSGRGGVLWGMIVPMTTTSKKKKGAKAAPKPAKRNWAFPAIIAAVVLVGIVIVLIAALGKEDTPASDITLAGGGPGDAAPVLTVEGGPTEQGQAAPSISGVDMYTGRTVSLQEMQGKPTLLTVWAHWCPHCQKELPIIQQLSQEQAGNFNFLTVSTSAGSQPAAGQYATPATLMKTQGITMPSLRDDGTKAMQALGAEGFPTLLMIDADGNAVGKASGEMPKDQLLSFMQNPTWTGS